MISKKMTKISTMILIDIPMDVLVYVLPDYITLRTIGNLCCVSKYFNELFGSERFWTNKITNKALSELGITEKLKNLLIEIVKLNYSDGGRKRISRRLVFSGLMCFAQSLKEKIPMVYRNYGRLLNWKFPWNMHSYFKLLKCDPSFIPVSEEISWSIKMNPNIIKTDNKISYSTRLYYILYLFRCLKKYTESYVVKKKLEFYCRGKIPFGKPVDKMYFNKCMCKRNCGCKTRIMVEEINLDDKPFLSCMGEKFPSLWSLCYSVSEEEIQTKRYKCDDEEFLEMMFFIKEILEMICDAIPFFKSREKLVFMRVFVYSGLIDPMITLIDNKINHYDYAMIDNKINRYDYAFLDEEHQNILKKLIHKFWVDKKLIHKFWSSERRNSFPFRFSY